MSVSDSPIVPGEQLGDKDWRPEPGEVAGRTRRILAEAVRRQASDVHFNSHADGVHARCRVNGILHATDHLPHELGRRVVHHLKALAGMNIIERRRPQDGRMLLEIESTKVDFRLSTIFGLWGENLAIRIFDRSGRLCMDRLYFLQQFLAVVRNVDSHQILSEFRYGRGAVHPPGSPAEDGWEDRGRLTIAFTNTAPCSPR